MTESVSSSSPSYSSDIYTNQGEDHTCAYHATAKIFMQNLFQFFSPSVVDRVRFNDQECTHFFHQNVYRRPLQDPNDLIRQCSAGGYDKILQFYYVYSVINEFAKGGTTSLQNVWAHVVNKIVSLYIPDIFKTFHPDNLAHLTAMLKRTVGSMKESNLHMNYLNASVEWSTASEKAVVFDLVKTIVGKGFYVYLSLRPNDGGEFHHVHVVNIMGGKMVVKNSHGEFRTHLMAIDGPLWLDDTLYKIEYAAFLVPTTMTEHNFIKAHARIHRLDHDWLNYFVELKDLVTTIVPSKIRIKEQRKPRVFQRGNILYMSGEIIIFLEYTDNIRVLRFDKPTETFWYQQVSDSKINEKYPDPLQMSDEEWGDARRLLTFLAEEDREALARRQKILADTKATRVVDIKKRREITDMVAKASYNLYTTLAALEKVEQHRFAQYVPKKFRGKTIRKRK